MANVCSLILLILITLLCTALSHNIPSRTLFCRGN